MSREYHFYVYMMASKNNRALYTGVTNDLIRRPQEHKDHVNPGFSSQYNTIKLVWYEETDDIGVAIAREKEIKKWRREKKNKLVDEMNPEWRDLYPELLE